MVDKGFSIATRPTNATLTIISDGSARRRQADWVVVSAHCHEFGGETLLTARTRGAGRDRGLFHGLCAQAIDTGADVFVGHGSHFPMGVEIYQGKPIFYSVGNFVFQNETVGFFPADAYERFDLDLRAPSDFLDARTSGGKKGHPSDPAYWENMFAVCHFDKRAQRNKNLSHRPRLRTAPAPARPTAARRSRSRVIERVTRSRRYGTKISNRDGVGVIEI